MGNMRFAVMMGLSASAILAWRLAQERKGGCMSESDRLATRLIAASFAALAAYVVVDGLSDLVRGAKPGSSVPGVVLTDIAPIRGDVTVTVRRRPSRIARRPRAVVRTHTPTVVRRERPVYVIKPVTTVETHTVTLPPETVTTVETKTQTETDTETQTVQTTFTLPGETVTVTVTTDSGGGGSGP